MSDFVYLVMLLYNSIIVIFRFRGEEFGVRFIFSHSLQIRMEDYYQ